jgi:N-acetylmuramoyl-L-alanine amidase
MAIKIGLDAGHGLKTAGKQTPDGIKEWSINDAVCDKITTILAEYDCEIIRTDNNEGNIDEGLSTRLNAYLNAGVSVFISIHHNALNGRWGTHTGVEVYTDKNATAKDKELAKLIYNKLVKNTGLKGRGVKKANFVVINQNKIPALLCEGGFMDGKKDYNTITSDAGQTAYAKAVADSLIEFLGLKKKAVPTNNVGSKNNAVLEWQKAAIADGFKFPKYGADGKWGSECVSVATAAICKKRTTYKYQNLTKIVQKAVGTTADGKFGNNTRDFVKAYQSRYGLTADGVVGLNTWKKIVGVK